MKASIFIFILAVLAAGAVVAQENSASSSPTSATAEAVSITDQADQIGERGIDERIIDRLGLFDRSDDGGSGHYSVSLDLENEDSDWSFEVTVTMEFLIRTAEREAGLERSPGGNAREQLLCVI